MSDPMSDERLAEIHERAGLAVEQLTGDGSSTEFCVQAMPYLLAEVERLRAEVKRLRAALGTEVRRNSGRTAPSGAPDSVVRSWAAEHGIPTNPKGRVAPDVRSAYEAAWRDEQDGA